MKDDAAKCCTQYVSKFRKLSSGHRADKGQFSFQSQRRSEIAQSCMTLCNPIDCSLPGSSIHGIFQGIFLTWRSNPGLPHCGQMLYPLSHQGSPKKDSAKECPSYCTTVLISHASKVMLKILQARPQQYINQELPDVKAGFLRGRGARDQIANICWIIEKSRELQKNIYFINYAKVFDCMDHNKLKNS